MYNCNGLCCNLLTSEFHCLMPDCVAAGGEAVAGARNGPQCSEAGRPRAASQRGRRRLHHRGPRSAAAARPETAAACSISQTAGGSARGHIGHSTVRQQTADSKQQTAGSRQHSSWHLDAMQCTMKSSDYRTASCEG